MKKSIATILAALFLIPAAASAQGVTVSASPAGAQVSVGLPFLNFVYTTGGYYDNYGCFHPTAHRHHYRQHRCKECEKAWKHYRKEQKKHRKDWEKAQKHSHPTPPHGQGHGKHCNR